MNWQKRPSFAATFWFLAFVVVSWLLIRQAQNREFAGDDDITFDRKFYFDTAETMGDEGLVSMSGTLAGDGLGYKNNTINISCYKDLMECLITQLEQIGPHQVGSLRSPDFYKITKWDAFEIVSVDDFGPTACVKVTVSVERKSKTALWVQEPMNQARAFCKNADTKIYKWTIEDSLFWQRIDKQVGKLSH